MDFSENEALPCPEVVIYLSRNWQTARRLLGLEIIGVIEKYNLEGIFHLTTKI